jgi:two-component system catabolic regulation response regulator CreB
MQEVLLSFGMDVAWRSAKQAWAKCTQAPDLLLVDVDAWVDGLAYRMVQRGQLARIPIIVVSARTAQADQHEALFAGADAFLAKPFTADELRKSLRPFLPSGTSL